MLYGLKHWFQIMGFLLLFLFVLFFFGVLFFLFLRLFCLVKCFFMGWMMDDSVLC